MAMTAAQRSLRARLAAYERWSRSDPVAGTQAARAAFHDRFARQVDPDGVLPEDERLRRADSARRAYFSRLALKSSQARAARSGGRGLAEPS